MLGNWDCESNCEPGRLQGDFSSYRTASKAYVAGLVNGTISRQTFMNDQKGFGLAQWTHPQRKADMYDTWKSSGQQIDSVQFQVNFAMKELARDFSSLLTFLKTTNDIYQACSKVCYQFENPAVKNVDARYRSANRIRYEINLDYDGGKTPIDSSSSTSPTPEKPSWEDVPATEYWPPRTVDKNMIGKDITALKALLYAREYPILEFDNKFNDDLEKVVKRFQQSNDLIPDGIVGKKTWAKLLEM